MVANLTAVKVCLDLTTLWGHDTSSRPAILASHCWSLLMRLPGTQLASAARMFGHAIMRAGVCYCGSLGCIHLVKTARLERSMTFAMAICI